MRRFTDLSPAQLAIDLLAQRAVGVLQYGWKRGGG